MLKKLIFIIFLIYSPLISSAELKVLYIGDTLDESIGGSAVYDIIKIHDLMQRIGYQTNLKVQETIIVHDLFKPENVFESLKDIKTSPEDVIVIYYSGHGYQNDSSYKNPWPSFYIGRYAVKFEQLIEEMEQHSAHLKIVISDCCNISIPEAFQPKIYKKRRLPRHGSVNNTERDNYRRLFLNHEGTIFITSSSPGEYSYGYYNGGFFTEHLANTLMDKISYLPDISWEELLCSTVRATAEFAEGQDIKQTPYYEINMELIK